MDTGTVIGNETRIFVARNFAVFQNRARWSIFGGFVMRPTDVCQRRSAMMGIVRAVQESRFFRARTQALCRGGAPTTPTTPTTPVWREITAVGRGLAPRSTWNDRDRAPIGREFTPDRRDRALNHSDRARDRSDRSARPQR